MSLVRSFLICMTVFYFSNAFANMSGTFMVVKGEVKVLRASETLKAKVTMSVYPGDTILSAKDSRAKIVMQDKNIIHISPSTEMKIETYVNNGQQKNVELNLKEGKVRNNVEQTYDGQKNKFIIKTPTAVAGVRGTQFITSFDKKTNETQIVTLHGKVELTNIPSKPDIPQTTVVVSKDETASTTSTEPPKPPQTVPADKMKAIDKDSTVGNKDSAPKTNDPGKAPETPQKGDLKKQPEARVEDPQDQSPKTFDKLPDIKNTTPLAGSPPPAFQRQPPPINNLPGDAIRQNNDKARVKVVPRTGP
ncbi:FecR family protein [bacterium]|nr:FecR family protein [bacterium]